MRTLIKNVTLVSPGEREEISNILLDDGRISSVSAPSAASLSGIHEEIEGAGLRAVPGFIDIHSHGADGADVCDNSLESVRHIAQKKLQEGVSTWLPTTLTQPRKLLAEIVNTVSEYYRNPEFTRCPGLHLEGPFINKEKAGAQNPEFVRPPDADELHELIKIMPAKLLSLAPEMPGACELISQAVSAGIVCSAAHTSASYHDLSSAIDCGLRHLTHFGNAMSPLHHREIGVVGAGLYDARLNIELICDLIHLSPDMLKLIFSLVPLERIMLITDSVAASWKGHGEIKLGGLEVSIVDNVARLKHGGALAGSTLKANEGLANVAKLTGLSLSKLIRTTAWNQAQSLGLEGLGKIATGYHADITLLRPDFSVARTIVAGKSLYISP